MKIDILCVIYAIFQKALDKDGYLAPSGKPKKLKNLSELDQDSIALYKWIAEEIRHIPEHKVKESARQFNQLINKLETDYFQNSFLTGVYLLDRVIEDFPQHKKTVVQAKTYRIIMSLRIGIYAQASSNEEAIKIIKDSSALAMNILRTYNKEPELTRAMREYKTSKRKKNESI